MRKGSKRCSYCYQEAESVIYVCPAHAKALDKVATRRKDVRLKI